MNKQEYEAERIQLESKLAQVRQTLAAAKAGEVCLTTDEWNKLYDREDEIEKELADLADQWVTRDWTWADWLEWNRICQNMD